jgi:hypothetical protein
LSESNPEFDFRDRRAERELGPGERAGCLLQNGAPVAVEVRERWLAVVGQVSDPARGLTMRRVCGEQHRCEHCTTFTCANLKGVTIMFGEANAGS